jgi:hypothetical protein
MNAVRPQRLDASRRFAGGTRGEDSLWDGDLRAEIPVAIIRWIGSKAPGRDADRLSAAQQWNLCEVRFGDKPESIYSF